MTASAVLLSGGLDSAVLLIDEATRGEVQPIYVSVGLAWEQAERSMIDRFVAAHRNPAIRPVAELSLSMKDVYAATHWAVAGTPPAYHTPDEDVYLPGRNVILLSKAAAFCAAAAIGRIAIGTLAHNPFPDATPEFRTAMARALTLGLGRALAIAAPYADCEKAEVVRRGAALGVRFDLTLSCMNPQFAAVPDPVSRTADAPRHCGLCSKCRERHDAFVAAGVPDPTEYVDSRYVRA